MLRLMKNFLEKGNIFDLDFILNCTFDKKYCKKNFPWIYDFLLEEDKVWNTKRRDKTNSSYTCSFVSQKSHKKKNNADVCACVREQILNIYVPLEFSLLRLIFFGIGSWKK